MNCWWYFPLTANQMECVRFVVSMTASGKQIWPMSVQHLIYWGHILLCAIRLQWMMPRYVYISAMIHLTHNSPHCYRLFLFTLIQFFNAIIRKYLCIFHAYCICMHGVFAKGMKRILFWICLMKKEKLKFSDCGLHCTQEPIISPVIFPHN